MAKDTKISAAIPQRKDSPRPRAMSLEKAKELVRKTANEHKSLFRRLAK